ncbi:hypothetical protein MASR1M60_31530 [Rhodocyclaceae bacterium]
MNIPYRLQLQRGIELREDGADCLIGHREGRALRCRQPGPGLRTLLHDLRQGEQSAEQLIASATAAEPAIDATRLYFLLAKLEAKHFLTYTLAAAGQAMATLEPMAGGFRFDHSPPTGRWRWSRFACLRHESEDMLAEGPLGHARVVLHDPRLCALVGLLAVPRNLDELAIALPALAPELLAAAVSLLRNAGVVGTCDAAGQLAEETDAALRHWEFHDLYFHSRSRSGRHAYPLGGTYRFKGELAHAPALKASMSPLRTELPRPTTAPVAADFFAVLDARRSRRAPGVAALTLTQLGEFLWWSARVQQHHPADPQRPDSYESTLRPYPGGGAMHELELYLNISRCSGLAPGLYHYDPLAHALEYLAEAGDVQQALLQGAMNSSGLKQPPDVLITVASRFGRLAWKYEGVAYALTLKNLGGLYQQMYLVATALGLAPCALGAGNSDTFAQATGLDYFAETAVGEFMLSAG